MIILLFIESRLNFKNIPLNSTFKSSINYEYIVYRNENPISCFLEFLVSLIFGEWEQIYTGRWKHIFIGGWVEIFGDEFPNPP